MTIKKRMREGDFNLHKVLDKENNLIYFWEESNIVDLIYINVNGNQ